MDYKRELRCKRHLFPKSTNHFYFSHEGKQLRAKEGKLIHNFIFFSSFPISPTNWVSCSQDMKARETKIKD